MTTPTPPTPSVRTAPLTSAWQRSATREPAQPALAGAVEADIAVVGGGLAGLSAAYHLRRADPAARLVLIEAVTVGSGSSGRSTGIMGPNVGGPITVLRRRYGDDVARAMYVESLDYVRHGIDLVRSEGLDCDLREGVQLMCALTAAQSRSLAAQARAFAELDLDVRCLAPDELTTYVRSPRYLAGLRHPASANLDPYRLCRALSGRLIASGVEIFEHTPLLRLEPGSPVTLRTAGGSVRARRVVLATDSHTAAAGRLATAVTPMLGHVVRTAPLTDTQLESVGLGQGDSVVDVRSFFDYYRVTVDHRLVLGGARVAVPSGGNHGHAVGGTRSDQAWRRIERELAALFPGLGPVEIADRWSGRMGSTIDRLPVVGPLPDLPGVWYSGAWCGHGIALSIGSGARLAEQLTESGGGPSPTLAQRPESLPWLRGRAPLLPPHPLRVPGLRLYIRGLDAADRPRLRARRDAA